MPKSRPAANAFILPDDMLLKECVELSFTTSGFAYHSLRKYISVHVNGVLVKLQLDTASDITIISQATWILLGRPAYKNTTHIARAASGEQLAFIGEINCEFRFRKLCSKSTCYISQFDHLNLLGIDLIEKLGLWNVPFSSICDDVDSSIPTQIALACDVASILSKDTLTIISNLKSNYSELFSEGLGLCSKAKAILYLRPGSRPVFVPNALYLMHQSTMLTRS